MECEYVQIVREAMREAVGAVADGMFVHLVNQETTKRTREAVDRGAQAAGSGAN